MLDGLIDDNLESLLAYYTGSKEFIEPDKAFSFK